MTDKIKILIVGNGFGGTYTLKNLRNLCRGDKRIELSLIGEKNYFLFTPLLHEIATGGINPQNIIEPIRKVLGHCLKNFYLGKAEFINLKNKTVLVDGLEISYDYLVLAPGATTNFYGIAGAENYCFTLKTLEAATRLKNHCILQMERASHISDSTERQRMLRFVVVGGGPTGVELAAEIEEFIQKTFSHYYRPEIIADTSIILIERGAELISQFGKKLRRKSLKVLEKKGIKVMLNSGVKKVTPTQIALEDGTIIETETPIWVAGVKPIDIKFDQEIERSENGKLIVNKYFQIENHKEVFALGDNAHFMKNGAPLPALAQVAQKSAKRVAKNIKLIIDGKEPQPFSYFHAGDLLSIGRWMGIGEVVGFMFWGRFTWWVWRTVYLFKLISNRKKIEVAVDWTINLFSPRDISEM